MTPVFVQTKRSLLVGVLCGTVLVSWLPERRMVRIRPAVGAVHQKLTV